jgi:FkbM family methyltransferase
VLRRYARETPIFWAETANLAGFIDLMRVRLSLSKLGRLACRHPMTVDVSLASFGGRVRLRSHTTDISVARELILGDSYGALARNVRAPVRSIVDLGANTGLAARWLRTRWPDATLVCVEPEQHNAGTLRENIRDAQIIEACVGARERRVALRTRTGAWGYKMIELSEPDAPAETEVLTMERILGTCGLGEVDVLKCDIEGAERELFEDCASWIERVRLATVECHRGLDGDKLLALIESNGGHFELVDRVRDPERGYETVTLRNLALA